MKKFGFLLFAIFILSLGLSRPAQATPCLPQTSLEQAVLQAMQAQNFNLTPDYGQNNGNPIQEPPSVDVAVILFEDGCAPVFTNVLMSRDLPNGFIAPIDPQTLEVQGLQWKKDQTTLWNKGANWNNLTFQDLIPGTTGTRYPVPYPASLLKLMTGVKIIQLVDQGTLTLTENYTYFGTTKTIQQWMDEMITISSNDATFAMLKLLHDRGEIVSTVPPGEARKPCSQQTQRTETVNTTNALFASLGLDTLQMSRTRGCDGSFYNSAGSGVGWHHMTAWDTARLLWLLDTSAPAPGWLVNGQPVNATFMSHAAKDLYVNQFLGQQGFHEVLSTTALCGQTGRAEGIPADLPNRWIAPNGSVTIDGLLLSNNAFPCDSAAQVTFAHKTGLSENYGSDAGIVKSIQVGGRHYIIAFVSNLGYRYTNTCTTTNLCYTQKIPAMAYAIDQAIANADTLPTPTPTVAVTPSATPTPTATPAAGNTGQLGPSAHTSTTGGDNNGFETTPANAYLLDGLFAQDMNSGKTNSTSCTDRGKDKHLFYNFGINLLAGATVDGIEIRLDAKADSSANTPTLCIELSWNGGGSWTSIQTTPGLNTTLQSYLLGGPTNTWGRTWSASDFSNPNFRVRITSVASSTSRDFFLDWVAVRVLFHE
ncbi:MAG: hypothetical protein HUU38_05055 [Anaerolineales bacterium]|nr:hypothetical protein [Anaerolineales bacterium]